MADVVIQRFLAHLLPRRLLTAQDLADIINKRHCLRKRAKEGHARGFREGTLKSNIYGYEEAFLKPINPFQPV